MKKRKEGLLKNKKIKPGVLRRSADLPRTNQPRVVTLSAREFDTVLAALRMWQADVTDEMTETEGIPADFADIALEHGDALTSEEIDSVIARINTEEA